MSSTSREAAAGTGDTDTDDATDGTYTCVFSSFVADHPDQRRKSND